MLKFFGFALLLIALNQAFFFLTTHQNLYLRAGVTRKMNFGEVSKAISERKVEVLQ